MLISKDQTPIIISEGTNVIDDINDAIVIYLENNCFDCQEILDEFKEIRWEDSEEEAYMFIEQALNSEDELLGGMCDDGVYFGSLEGDPCCVGFFSI